MLIGSRQKLSNLSNLSEIKVSIGSNEVERVPNTKTLDIIIDEYLKWKKHIDSTSKNISKTIGMLRRVKPFVSQDSLNIMYKSLILPHFDYCSLVWGNCNNSSLDKTQRLQNRAVRVITGDSYEIRSSDILTKLSWKTLGQWREQQTINVVNKDLKEDCPQSISNMFKISKNEKYNLRNNNQVLALSKPKPNAMKRSFSYLSANVWNKQSLHERNFILNY